MTSSETSTTNPCIHTLVFAPRHVKLPITSRDITVLQGELDPVCTGCSGGGVNMKLQMARWKMIKNSVMILL